MKKIFNYSLLIFIIFSLVFIFFEIFGLSKSINKNFLGKNNLIKENYYKKKFKRDPYYYFYTQYLHPYYFSFHFWDESKIKNYNEENNLINLNLDGFRKNPFNTNDRKKILLTGNSLAFGMYASSKETIIASQISKNKNIDVENLNSNFWNSNQELISILKFKEDYDLSISLSIARDIENFCNKSSNLKSNILDISHNFYEWNNFIENAKPISISQISFFKKVANFFASFFKNNIQLFYNLTQNKKENLFENFSKNCVNNHNQIADSFLKNQIKMKELAKMRGAEHITIIQPIAFLNFSYENKKLKNKINFYNKIISTVLNSDYCNKNCFNFSKIFKEQNINIVNFDFDKSNNYNIFYDNYNLLDDGQKIIAKKIINILDNSLIID
jgi:hypothetical protein